MTILMVDADYIVFEKDGETLKCTEYEFCCMLMRMGIEVKSTCQVRQGDVLFVFSKDIIIDSMLLMRKKNKKGKVKKK